jgi:YHS domain-containing protein
MDFGTAVTVISTQLLNKRIMKTTFLIATLLSTTYLTMAQTPTLRKQQYNLEKSALAIQGYDPVAYFTQSKAVKGSEANSFAYKGVAYRFASAANLKAFQASPDKYEPQYGGWCAYAMGATGEKVEVDPETFKVVDGKLYLFYHSFINNTLTKWNKDEANLHRKADVSWSKFVAGQ